MKITGVCQICGDARCKCNLTRTNLPLNAREDILTVKASRYLCNDKHKFLAEQILLPVVSTRALPIFEMMESLDISKNYLPIKNQ